MKYESGLKHMKKRYLAAVLVFLLLPLLLLARILGSNDRAVSANENRTLRTRSEMSVDFAGGQFQTWLEDYLSDQFPLRDSIKGAETEWKLTLGSRNFDGAYVGKDCRLFQKITSADVDEAKCARYARRINRLAQDTGLPTYVMYVPSAGIALKELLPKGAPMYDGDALFDTLAGEMPDVVMMDVRAQMAGHPEYYYRTDHHWTGQGVARAYEIWRQAHGWEPLSEMPEQTVVSRNFHGTLYSKAPSDRIPFDTIESFIPPFEPVTEADGREIPFFDETALRGKDQYNFFQGGNHGITVLQNPEAEGGGTLLLLKDSFANSLAPWLITDYRRIVMVDERYAFVDLRQLAEEYEIDEIAVVREMISVP